MDYKEFSSKIKAKHPGAYDDLSDEDLARKMIAKYPEYSDVTFDATPSAKQESFPLKAWHALQKPSEMAAGGLHELTHGDPEAVNPFLALGGSAIGLDQNTALKAIDGFRSLPTETGNLPYDIARGTPKIALQTLEQVAPSFVNRASLLSAGLARAAQEAAPLAKTVLRGIGSQAEQMSGIAPKAEGALEAAYKDPSLIFQKGKRAASEIYEAGKAAADKPYSAEVLAKLKAIPDKLEYVKQARQLAQEGVLGQAEALEARKALDGLKKTVRQDYFTETRKMLDAIVKSSDKLSQADEVYKRGVQAENLRNLVPQNKYGGASPFKLMLLKLTGGLAAPALVPAVQGATATGAGVAARQIVSPLANNPGMAAALGAILSRKKEKSIAK